jgi:hypothetical protein
MSLETRLRHSVLALAGIVTVGCSADVPTRPRAVAGPTKVLGHVQHAARLHPNAEKYRDEGAHPATGRSGSAFISARALLGKDSYTTLELSTGLLDVSPPAGLITAAHLKLWNGSDFIGTTNSQSLDAGTVLLRLGGLLRQNAIDVQANVRGIDGHRTDVVSLRTNVLLRPDLYVILAMPNEVAVNSTVSIFGYVAEGNGDVGARTNCDLYIDGAHVDRAPRIWVDAGSSVFCAFSHRFTRTGSHTVRIVAGDVAPGDFDDANNRDERTIAVIEPVFPVYYWMLANDGGLVGHVSQRSEFTSTDGASRSASGVEFDHVSHNNKMGLIVSITGETPFPIDQIAFSLKSDGVERSAFSATNLPATSAVTQADGTTETCNRQFSPERYFEVCSYLFFGVTPFTSTRLETGQYDAVYFGYSWSCSQDATGSCVDFWTSPYEGTDGNGAVYRPLGSTLEFEFSMVAGGHSYAFSREGTLPAAVDHPWDFEFCSDFTFEFGSLHSCWADHGTETGRSFMEIVSGSNP